MRQFADSCDPSGFGAGYAGYLGYVDGVCAFRPAPNGIPVMYVISSLATNAGTIGDCEPGNPGWPTWVAWVQQRRAAGVDPTIYCMDDGKGGATWNGWRHSDGVAAFAAAGVTEPHWWVAHPDGDWTLPSYAVAIQYAYPGPFDVSYVADYWPGIDGPGGGFLMALTDQEQAELRDKIRQLWSDHELNAAGAAPTGDVALLGGKLAELAASLAGLQASVAAIPGNTQATEAITSLQASVDKLNASLVALGKALTG